MTTEARSSGAPPLVDGTPNGAWEPPQTAAAEAQHVAAPPPSGRVLARSVSILFGGQLVSWATTLLWTLVVPRHIGASEMGVYTLGQAATGTLLVVVGLGLRPYLVREIAADPSRAPQLLGSAIVLRALLTLPALAVVALVVAFGGFSGGEKVAVVLGWTQCLFYVVSEPILAAFQAMERMSYLAYATILTGTIVNLSAIGLVMVGVEANGLLTVQTAMVLLLAFLSVAWLRPHIRVEWRTTVADLRRLVVDSLPYSSFAAFFTIYLWIDSFLLGALAPDRVLGWYGLPTRLFGSLMVVPVILATAWLPQLVRSHSTGGDEALARAARPSLELVLILSMPVCVGTVLVSGPLVRALYGGGFEGSVPVLALLACCVPPMYVNIMANQVMIASKKQVVWTRMMILASVLNPLLNLWLIPFFQRTRDNGAIGAALAMIVTEVVIAAVALVMVRHALAPESALRILKAAAATGIMALATHEALQLDLLAGVAAGIVTFAAAGALLGILTLEERRMLLGAARSVAGRLRPRGGTAR